MISIPFIQTISFIIYIAYVVLRYGVLSSISDSYYAIGDDKPNYLFILFLWSMGLPATFLYHYSIAFTICGMLLLIVGVTADFKDKITGLMHGTAATVGISVALLGLVLNHIYVPLILAIIASLLINWKKLRIQNTTWWVEVVCFIAIEIGLFIMLI